MLRLGIVDFDSSHSIEFTRRLNRVGCDPEQFVDGAQVVLGCPGSSEMSPERIPLFMEQVQACGVQLVENPEEMIGRIDAVLVLSLCGSAHLARVRPFLQAGIPAYVDKPFACSREDADEMVTLAERSNTLLYHSSALRFAAEVLEFQDSAERQGELHGVVSYGPAKRAAGNPGLFHYGIHPTAVLFALMGVGCRRVTTAYTVGAEVVTAVWDDGRIGTLRGNRQGSTAYGFLAFCANGVLNRSLSSRFSYRNLCRSIVESFSSGKPVVSHELNLEEVRFVEAASESERRNGEPVEL